MKTCSAGLQAHLSQGQTTLAWLFKVKRVDGTILGFTGHDQPITFDNGDGDGPVTYEASTGFTGSADAAKNDLSVPNIEATAFLSSGSITEADIRALKYDNASFTVMVVNWANLGQGCLTQRGPGIFGNVKMQNGVGTVELRGLASLLTSKLGGTYGPICRATFGSGLNGIDINSHWLCLFDVTTVRQSGSVGSVTDSRTIVPSAGLSGAAGYFNDGFITFTSGALDGASFEIKTWDGTTLELFLGMPSLPSPGDTFSIEPGCDHTVEGGCTTFNNVVNFQGENAIPGMDQLLDNPSLQ